MFFKADSLVEICAKGKNIFGKGAEHGKVNKKDKTVRFMCDFGELNKRVKRTPCPIPKIQDALLKLQGFMCATSLDLNMG